MKHSLPIVLAMLSAPAWAEGGRTLSAHEHGVGALNIAIDGETVAMEFHAPGADIVGFEYEATSAADRAAIDEAVAILARPLNLFVPPAAAECTVIKASAGLESEYAHGNAAHASDVKSDDAHEDHAAGEDQTHDEHAHDDHAKAEESHTEFHAEYTLTCAAPGAFTRIDFAYFEAFENAREVDVKIVTATSAKAFDVAREAPTLDLRGMF